MCLPFLVLMLGRIAGGEHFTIALEHIGAAGEHSCCDDDPCLSASYS